ncbi:MAG: hypothetical protein LBK71_02945 [Verrucomicrobiales bacterium]|jgi:hypothetical protein|nr:hypothetical protein [Verrucomicrobiales bacterium]
METGALPSSAAEVDPPKPTVEKFTPFIWPSAPPADCPFPLSMEFTKVRFLGVKSGFRYGDTFYPSWADDDKMYSPFTDGRTWRRDGGWDDSNSMTGGNAVTGQAVIEGDDPLTLTVYSIGLTRGPATPYQGRYPCGSLVYNGVWYYGTYTLGPSARVVHEGVSYNWPWLGPFVGFRVSRDKGATWEDGPHTPEKNIFGETGLKGEPVKIGSPHFVDFGKNLEHSPDGKAYMVAHGSEERLRYFSPSWITGDRVYLLRVSPSAENMNDPSKWEFYAGKDARGQARWTSDFAQIQPLLAWDNNMGCVTVTYNAPLRKYFMCVTDGGNTCEKMNTYILESDSLTGDWRLVSYLKDFGEQAYFVNIPSRFIAADGQTMWLLYSGNFAPNWNGQQIKANPPGSHYGLVLQKIRLER